MIAITKGMVALSAVVSAGFVTVYDMVATPDAQSAAAQVSQRFPAANEMFVPINVKPGAAVATPKGDRASMTEHCTRQDWPYIAQICLTSSDGKPIRKVSRIITVERRTGENSSELSRVPVATLANR